MNRDICGKCSKPIELCDCPTGTTYDLIRRQHEAIVKLREALEDIQYCSSIGCTQWQIAEQALKDTEEFK